MTRVKFSSRPFEQSFNNLVDDFFFPPSSLLQKTPNGSSAAFKAPVNIEKTDAGYELKLLAPGFEKENFRIVLDQQLLTISVQANETAPEKKEKMIRQEFRLQSFKRSFTLDENLDAEKIEARYEQGILVVNIPEKTEKREPVKQITIQ